MLGRNCVSMAVCALISTIGVNLGSFDAWAQDLYLDESTVEHSSSDQRDGCDEQAFAAIKRCFQRYASVTCTQTLTEGGFDIDCTNNLDIQQCYARVATRKERCLGDSQSFSESRDGVSTKSRVIKSKQKAKCPVKSKKQQATKSLKCDKSKRKLIVRR